MRLATGGRRDAPVRAPAHLQACEGRGPEHHLPAAAGERAGPAGAECAGGRRRAAAAARRDAPADLGR